jgi:FlaA1/EpsC-like NDP-sugar epimerase
MNNYKEKTILVTGATGTVGSEVVKQLAAISSSSGHKIWKISGWLWP